MRAEGGREGGNVQKEGVKFSRRAIKTTKEMSEIGEGKEAAPLIRILFAASRKAENMRSG